ncbi:MAG: BlaI/MecI/CopY family transcriptional regulator [Mucilaginibacter polytrichastri]|nr:BlaI/MecI/CopY family transcriptional regulator [Mucilaginibacter polytrichastri]
MIKPTDSELDILRILWQNKWLSVRDVHDELQKSKEAGYTTTLKLMQIMLEKGLVERDDRQRTHLYRAVYSQQKAQKNGLEKMIDTLFDGSASKLVLQALGGKTTSEAELQQIREYLDQLSDKKS